MGQTITSDTPVTIGTGTIVSGNSTGVLNATTGATLTNNGTITGTSLAGVSNQMGDSFTTLTNEPGGTISGGDTGINNTGEGSTIGALSNSGTITGSNRDGIHNIDDASIGTLSNSGVISGGEDGIQNGTTNNTGGAGFITTLSNSGTITGGTTGIFNGEGSTIGALNNSGTIIGRTAIESVDGGTIGTITNTGLISGNITITGQNVTIFGGSGDKFGTITGNSFDVSPGDTVDFAGGNQEINDNISGNVQINGTLEEDIVGPSRAAFLAANVSTAHDGFGTANGFNVLGVTNGNVTIDPGATLVVKTSFEPAVGEIFTIASAPVIETGGSDPVAIDSTGLARFELTTITSGTTQFLELEVVAAPSFKSAGLNVDGASAGNVIDETNQFVDPTVPQAALSNAANGLLTAQIPQFVASLDGQIHAAMVAVAPQVSTATADSVFGHLNEVANDPADSRQIWDNVSTQFGSRGSDGTANGLSSNVTQEAIGVDLLAQGATRFGIGYAFGSTDVRSDGGSGSSQENAAFVYGQVAAGRYLLNGIVSYGATSSNTQRAAPLGDTVLRTNGVGGGDALGAIGLSRPFILQDITLAPYGRVTVQQVSQNSATEGTASITALSIDSFAGTGVRGMLGVTGGSNAASPLAAPYTYQFDAGVGEDAGNLVNPSLHATLVGVGLSIAAPRVSSTFAQLSVSGTVRFNNSAYAYANLFGEARGNATLAGITGGLRVTF